MKCMNLKLTQKRDIKEEKNTDLEREYQHRSIQNRYLHSLLISVEPIS
jgi:hypothetical protein